MLTQTRALPRSRAVSTRVIVAKPRRGSFISRCRSAISSAWIWLSSLLVRWLMPSRRDGSGARLLGHHLEALDDVALGDVVGVEADATLETGGHFPDVILEATERGDARLHDEGAAPEEPRLATADDAPVGDVGAGDVARAPGLDHHPNLGVSLDLLHQLGRQEAREGLAHVVGELVDHVVEPDIDARRVDGSLGARIEAGG